MTTKTTDEDIIASNLEADIEEEAEAIDDPSVIEMLEAEKEIEALKAETEADAPKSVEAKDKTKGVMPVVPKARFDEVLSERDLLRDQVGYMRGVIDAGDQSRTANPTQQTPNNEPSKEVQKDSEVDSFEAAINTAEQKKLELAEKYDNGDINTVELRKAEIELDREIRGLADQRETARFNNAQEVGRSETKAALNAQQQSEWINTQALAVQKNHPNVAVIDASSIKDVLWQQIEIQAKQNLTQRGVNVNYNSPETRMEIIKEKARLTDTYTPEALKAFLPKDYKAPSNLQQSANGQTNAGQKQMSDNAILRARKLELADSQPPTVADMGNGNSDGELTESDIEGMTEDQMADLLERAPNLVKRAVGNSI